MVEPFAELLMHFASARSAARISQAFLDSWGAGPRSRMLAFGRSGPGVEPNADALRSRVGFDRDAQEAAITLQTSRTLRGSDRVKFYFTNPSHHYHEPPNFLLLSFFHDGVATARKGYEVTDLQALIRDASLVEKPASVSVERYGAIHHPGTRRAVSELSSVGLPGLMPYWLCGLPHWAFDAVREYGHVRNAEVLCELSDSMVLVRIGQWPFVSVDEHVATLVLAAGGIREWVLRKGIG